MKFAGFGTKVERTASWLQGGFKFKTSMTNERSNNIQFNKFGGGNVKKSSAGITSFTKTG